MKFRRPYPGNRHNPGQPPTFYLQQDPVTGLYRKCEIPHYALSADTTIHLQMTERQLAGMILLLVIIAILFVIGVIIESRNTNTFSFPRNETRNQ